MKLQSKAWIALASGPLVVLLGAVILFETVVIPWEVDALVGRSRTVVRALQAIATRIGPEGTQGLAEALRDAEPDLAYVIVVDRDGRAITHSEPGRVGKVFADAGTLAAAREGKAVEQLYVRDAEEPDSPHHGERVVDILVPLFDGGGAPAGAANVGLSLTRVERVKWNTRVALLAFAVFVTGVALWLRRRVLGDFVEPVDGMARAARRLARGERVGAGLPVGRDDEIGELARDFRTMAEEIESLVVRLSNREQELQAVIDGMPTAVCKFSPEGRVELGNRQAAEPLGLTPRTIVGRMIWDLWPTSPALVRSRLARAIAEGSLRFDHEFRSPDGRVLHLDITYCGVHPEAEAPYVIALAVDVTDRVQAEASLRRSEARYRTLAEAASDLIYIVREDRTLIYANGAVARRIGRTQADMVGKPVDVLFHPGVVAGMEKLVDRAFAAPGPVRAEARVPRTLGPGFVWYDSIAVTLPGAEDGHRAVLCIARDVTERKEMQARLLAADRMVSIGTLAAGVAHEINNPLSYVLANLQLVGEELAHNPGVLPAETEAELKEMVGEALEGANRVRAIVRDLKTFSRSDEDLRVQVEVSTVLDTALRMAWNQVRHRARLVKDYGPVPPIVANEARLGQVIVNLVVNAAQAMPEGRAAENEIRVSTTLEDDQVVIAVADTGCGIPEEHLASIFHPFFTTKPVGEGTGLGLAICQGIVQGLGGEIRVSSEVGKGTTMRVVLPVGVGDAPRAPAPPPAPVPAHRARILAVDDEAAVCRVLAATLDRHEVVALTAAREALGRVEAGERFDLILCDVMMPEMTGAQLHEAIARVDAGQAARMVFLTGGAFGPAARAFLDRVPNPRLEKPFVVEQLRRAVDELLAGAPPARA